MRRLLRTKTLTALDIDGRVLRIAQSVRRGGRTRVTRLVAEPLPASGDGLDLEDPAAVGAWLKRALRRLRIKPGRVVMGMPRRKVILKPLALPRIDDESELAAMVRLQVERDLPFPADQAVIDFTIQEPGPETPATDGSLDPRVANGAPAGAPPNVLVAAVDRARVEHYLKIAAAAGFHLHALGLRSYANVRCIELCGADDAAGGVALVYLRPDEVYIDVVLGKKLAFSRAVSVGVPEARGAGNAFDPAAAPERQGTEGEEDPIATVSREVVRTIMSYVGVAGNRTIKRVLIAGVTGNESAVSSALAARLDMPCGLLDPKDLLEVEREQERLVAPAAITVIGLAVAANEPRGMSFDFLHPKRPAVKRSGARSRMMLAAAALVALVVCGFVVRERLLRGPLERAADLRGRIAALERWTSQHRAYLARASGVAEWTAQRLSWLDHWAYLSGVLPPCTEVYLTGMTTTSTGAIRLSVQATSDEVLADLDTRLRESGYAVSPIGVTSAKDRFGYVFRTTVEMRPGAGLAIDLKTVSPPDRPADDASAETALVLPAAADRALVADGGEPGGITPDAGQPPDDSDERPRFLEAER